MPRYTDINITDIRIGKKNSNHLGKIYQILASDELLEFQTGTGSVYILDDEFITVTFKDKFIEFLNELQTCVEEKLNTHKCCIPFNNNVQLRVDSKCKYYSTSNGSSHLSFISKEDIKRTDKVVCSIRTNGMWVNDTHCGIRFIVQEIALL